MSDSFLILILICIIIFIIVKTQMNETVKKVFLGSAIIVGVFGVFGGISGLVWCIALAIPMGIVFGIVAAIAGWRL